MKRQELYGKITKSGVQYINICEKAIFNNTLYT